MKIVISQFMSLDGVVQAPGGADEDTDGGFAHGGWSMPYFDPESMGGAIDAAMTDTDALLFGRRTWQVMAGAWPDRDDGSDPFASRMNAFTKYVVTSTLSDDDLTWENSTIIPGDDVVAGVDALREKPGGTLSVMGSSQLCRTLVAAGLVDEYLFMIEPVLLGGGKGVFPTDGELRPLELVSTTEAPTGVLICTYRPSVTPPMPDFD